jgi:hypothetical protein
MFSAQPKSPLFFSAFPAKLRRALRVGHQAAAGVLDDHLVMELLLV